MEAYVYVQVAPGQVPEVLTALTSKQGVRKAVAVVGGLGRPPPRRGARPRDDRVGGPVRPAPHPRASTGPPPPPWCRADRIGITGFGGPQPPPIIPNACYVHIRADAGAAAGIAEHLADMGDIAGVAVIGGAWDLLTCVAQPWEVASGLILDRIQSIPGVQRTSTLVSIAYEEPEEDRDQFSAWS